MMANDQTELSVCIILKVAYEKYKKQKQIEYKIPVRMWTDCDYSFLDELVSNGYIILHAENRLIRFTNKGLSLMKQFESRNGKYGVAIDSLLEWLDKDAYELYQLLYSEMNNHVNEIT